MRGFLYKWVFNTPKSKVGWRVSQCFQVWNSIWLTWIAFWLLTQQQGPPEVWALRTLGVLYAILAFFWVAMTTLGFFFPPDYATGKINVVIVPLYQDPADPKRLVYYDELQGVPHESARTDPQHPE